MADMEVIISGALIWTAVPVAVIALVLVLAAVLVIAMVAPITSRADGAGFESVHNYSHLTPFFSAQLLPSTPI